VVIIQAERSGDRVLVEFRYPRGGNGIATLDEMEIVSSASGQAP
jgi:hypothetical protein